MSVSLRIVVADDEPVMCRFFQEMLPLLGHQVVRVAQNGRELVEHVLAERPDLVITDIKMPERDGIDAAIEVYKTYAVPVILVSAYHDPELVARAEANHIMAYLIKPIRRADLETAIALAMWRFSQFEQLRKEAKNLREALEHRKLIERAKGILMRRAALDEEAAYSRLQTLARQKNLRVVDVAEIILAAEVSLEPPVRTVPKSKRKRE